MRMINRFARWLRTRSTQPIRECSFALETDHLTNLRELLFDRCSGYCERCGIPLAESWAMHHRLLKSRGGKDEITNVVALHHHCHNLGTNSVHLNPAEATRQGFMVPSGSNPANVPLLLAERFLVLLTDNGMYEEIEEGDGNGW